jgi:hypothetical protein
LLTALIFFSILHQFFFSLIAAASNSLSFLFISFIFFPVLLFFFSILFCSFLFLYTVSSSCLFSLQRRRRLGRAARGLEVGLGSRATRAMQVDRRGPLEGGAAAGSFAAWAVRAELRGLRAGAAKRLIWLW